MRRMIFIAVQNLILDQQLFRKIYKGYARYQKKIIYIILLVSLSIFISAVNTYEIAVAEYIHYICILNWTYTNINMIRQ